MSAWARQLLLALLMAPIFAVGLLLDLIWRLETQLRASARAVRPGLRLPVRKRQWIGSNTR